MRKAPEQEPKKQKAPAQKPVALTEVACRNYKPKDARYEVADAKVAGLRLCVQPSGAKSWVLRYRSEGRSLKWTIGGYPAVSLDAARKLAQSGLGKVAMGQDPAEEKKAKREAAKAAQQELKFPEALANYLAAHVERNLKRSTQREHKRVLLKETAPWKARSVASITKMDVLRLTDAMIARDATIGANRLHSRLSHFFNWAVTRGLIETNPCAALPKPTKEDDRARDRVLEDWELALVWRASEKLGFPYEHIIKLLMLTGARRGEVTGMAWSEIDRAKGTWTLPKERSKNKNAHELSLPPLAWEILSRLPRFERAPGETDYVFTPRNVPPNDFGHIKVALDAAITELNGKPLAPWVVHDIRRSVATGLGALGVEIHVTERILNHTGGSFKGIVKVYQRFRYEEQMRAALERWAAHIERVLAGAGASNVVELARAQQ